MTELKHTPGPLYVSAVRRTMDGQRWLRVCSSDDIERAYVPFGDRTTEEYVQCMADAKLYAEAPAMVELLERLMDSENAGVMVQILASYRGVRRDVRDLLNRIEGKEE